MRAAKACQQCRTGKRRCIADDDGGQPRCRGCQQRGLPCSRASKLKQFYTQRLLPASQADQPHESPGNTLEQLSPGTIIDCVDLYFRFVHDRPHSLFHEKSVRSRVQSGIIEDQLLLAICAIGCRFSKDHSHRRLTSQLRLESSKLLSRHLEEITLINIQTCILLANLCAAEQDNALEALYFGIANRMAYVLRLHESNLEPDTILKEIKCRVWWSLFMADRWCPPSLGLPREIMQFNPALELPKDEAAFQQTDESNFIGINCQKDGIWKYMITLVDILGPIQDLNLSLVQGHSSQNDVDQQVDLLVERLVLWRDTLPEHMTMNSVNLDHYRDKGHGGTFVALHLGYYHYFTLLLFQYLDALPSRSPKVNDHSDRCRYYALAFSKLLHHARSNNDCHVVYLTVAHMTQVSSSVLVHMLLFGDGNEVDAARTQLTHNFEALVELKEYWPHVELVIERLLTFQKACLQSLDPHTHRVDGWMVRFLLEHALPFADRDVSSNYGSASSPAISDTLLRRNNLLTDVLESWYRPILS